MNVSSASKYFSHCFQPNYLYLKFHVEIYISVIQRRHIAHIISQFTLYGKMMFIRFTNTCLLTNPLFITLFTPFSSASFQNFSTFRFVVFHIFFVFLRRSYNSSMISSGIFPLFHFSPSSFHAVIFSTAVVYEYPKKRLETL